MPRSIYQKSCLNYFSNLFNRIVTSTSYQDNGNLNILKNWINACQEGQPLANFCQTNKETLDVLEVYYGNYCLKSNFFSFTLREITQSHYAILQKLFNSFSEKSKQFINRNQLAFDNHHPDRIVPAISPLKNLVHAISDYEQILTKAYHISLIACPGFTVSSEQSESNVGLWESLGFSKVSTGETSTQYVLDQFASIELELSKLLLLLSSCYRIFGKNITDQKVKSELYRLSKEFSDLSAVVSSHSSPVNSEDFSLVDSESILEPRMSCLEDIGGRLEKTPSDLDEFLKPQVISKSIPLTRELVSISFHSLINQGFSGEQALMLSSKIANYCDQHNVIVTDLASLEAKKIDQVLTRDALIVIQQYFQNMKTGKAYTDQKEETLRYLGSVKEHFYKGLSASLLVVASFIMQISAGCGVKTAPRALVNDLRPEIPYRTADSLDQKTKEKKLKKEVQDNGRPKAP